MRADLYLASNGFCESRSKAAASIEAGCVFVNGRAINKCSFDIKDTDAVEIRGEVIPDVSRGGLKLRGAFEAFGVTSKDLICVDIGASTGGFTDVLLKNGAKKVYAVDCGRGQLHASLQKDKRVVNIEGFNARELSLNTLGQACDMAVMDVSFISQTLLHKAVSDVLKESGTFISLIKPQFEVGRENIGKGGIVKDKKAHKKAIESVVLSAQGCDLALLKIAVSPIKGGDGNCEYLAIFEKKKGSGMTLSDEYIAKLINENK